MQNTVHSPYLTALDDPEYKGMQGAGKVDQSFEPFRRYLDNAQKALEKKEVSCQWKALPEPSAVLALEQQVYEVKPCSEVEFNTMEDGWFEITRDLDDDCLLAEDFEPDITEPVEIGRGKNRKKIELTAEQYKQEDLQFYIHLGKNDEIGPEVDKISWTGYSLSIEPVSSKLPDNMELVQQGRTYRASRLSDNRYKLVGIPDAKQALLFEGQPLSFQLLSSGQLPNNSVEINARYFIASNNKPKADHASINKISHDFLLAISITDLQDSNGRSLPAHWSLTKQDNKVLLETSDDPIPEGLRHRLLKNLQLTCSRSKGDLRWIQLMHLDQMDDTGAGQDPLEYFFDGQVDILDQNEKPGNNAGYRVLKSKPDERQIAVCRKNDKTKKSVLPKQSQLTVKVNTLALWRQREAITHLKLAPALSQKPLLDLLKNREQQKWPDFLPIDGRKLEWSVLKDIGFDGCKEQREFVAKALATPDFAILDGPPGTGKTTTILELIVQLAREGKRILLTASTHAAINNVLERIDDHSLKGEVFPLRIGDEARAVGVEHHQYEQVKNDFNNTVDVNDIDQLMVDSSNLVCGTTMGILRLFNNRDLDFDTGVFPFDVMIIDECSKTTFAEFLVPARYAKRWVLVGDVKQLSPFTDREQITANLKQLVLQHKGRNREEVQLSADVQRACFLLNELRSKKRNQWGYHDKLVMPVSKGLLSALQAEIQARAISKQSIFDSVCLVGAVVNSITNEKLGNYLSLQNLKIRPWCLYEFNLIFCEQSVLENHQEWMPADAVVLSAEWRNTAHNFRHMARFDGEHGFGLKGKDRFSYSYDIHSKWFEHDSKACWADELVWRLEREYWLRFLTTKPAGRHSKNKGSKLDGIQQQIKQLLPKSVLADGKVYGIRNMAFPSILEALSGSGTLKQRNDTLNTLNVGFSPKEKQCRHTTLTYQHRMHPDISSYPRAQFYSDGNNTHSLLDGSQTTIKRQWSYTRYKNRSVWLDVNGQSQQNANDKEATAIIDELKFFCDWAANQNENQKEKYDVAILTFYKKQESLLRTKLQVLTEQNRSFARFEYKGVSIKLNTVDFFQGQEADLVFLSMVNTHRDGFLDSPNRLNVSVTRARFQQVVVGKYQYFLGKDNNTSNSNELNALAQALPVIKE